MGRYIAKRLANYVVLLFIAVTLTYFLAATQLNPRALYEVVNPPIDPVSIENNLRAKNLSDQVPLLQRWWTWVTGIVLHWDWERHLGGGSVGAEVGRRIWVSLRLITLGSLIGIVAGVLLGAWTATRQYKVSDRTLTFMSLFFLSVPSFVIASVLQVVATQANGATGLRLFEFVGETGARGSYPGAALVDRAQHILLPTVALVLLNAAFFSRIQRNLMLDALGSDFVRTARAKGLRRSRAVMKHALRTSLIPTGTYFAFSVATLFTGATFMEIIFSFHGMGEYGVSTILGQDVHGSVAVAAFSGVCVLFGAILADIMVAILDPSRTAGLKGTDMAENLIEVATGLPADEGTEPASGPGRKRLSRRQLILRRFLRNKTAVVGLVIIVGLVVMALIGPYVSRWAFDEVDRRAYLKPPSDRHLLGTTQGGRDMLSLTLRGLRKSLLIGFLVAAISTAVAAIVGSFAAYYGGWFERIALWVIDLLLVVPSFLLIALVTTGAPKGPNSWLLLVLLLAAFSWVLSARVVRSLSMSIKEREYVMAAKFMGLPAPTTIVRHILPNISSLLIIDATLNVGGAILAETGLSFFGFGVQAPDTSLGTLLGDGARQVNSFPWLFTGPAVVVLLVLSVNAVGDGLRDALDPNSSSGGSAR